MSPLRKLVHHDHNHIPSSFSRRNKWAGEVNGDGMPSVWRYGQRLMEAIRFGTGFVELTFIAGSDVVFHVFCQTWPVETPGDGVHCFSGAEVAADIGVMMVV